MATTERFRTMSDLHDHAIEHVFGGFIRGEPEVLRAVEAFAGELRVVDGALTFTVPALFAFVRASYAARGGAPGGADKAAYLRFRRSLYDKRTNQRLRARGGLVETLSPHTDHDLSVYRLVRCGQDGP